MKKLIFAILLTVMMVAGADATGKWKGSVETSNGVLEIEYQFKAEDGKLTGTASSQMGTIDITDGKVDGDNISFTIATSEYTVLHKGVVNGDELKITADTGSRTIELIAKRVPSPAQQ